MKGYLKSVAQKLKNYSLSLDKTSILIDKPWALIDDQFEMQKLIFKKDKELILSKNGEVQKGKWEYFPEAKCLLIDRNHDKILCNEAFIDKGVMILKVDGTDNRFFILANENIVPDLDADRYLRELRHQKLKIVEARLNDGRILEVERKSEEFEPRAGDPVTVDAEPIEDGKIKLDKKTKYFEIQDGRISKVLTERKYTTPEEQELFIQQKNSWYITHGDYVYMFGKKVPTSTINFSKSKNLIVRDGKVVRFERKNPFTRKLSNAWKRYFGDFYE